MVLYVMVYQSFIPVGFCEHFSTSSLSTSHKKHFDQSVSCFSSGVIDRLILFDMSKPKNELEQIYIQMFVEKNYITLNLSTNG